MELKEKMLASAQALQEELTAWRRELHRHPELDFDLNFTKAFVKERLNEMGCQPVDCGKAGVVVLLGKPGGKTFLIRGDMDALPIQEQADVPYKSENDGCMHACGHDMHTAMMLGAARLLKEYEGELKGQVKLMFQPAEETLGGAKDMVESGVLENPHVDAAAMLHVMTGTPIPNGCVLLPEGGTGMAASTEFKVTVKGKGGHGAMPQLSIDPINVLAHIHIALQEIHAREIESTEFLVLTSGMFHAGNANNVIPDTAELEGTIRTGSQKMTDFAKRRLTEISTAIATAFGATAEVEFGKSCPPMLADETLAPAARTYLGELLGPALLPPVPTGSSKVAGGSEDFAYVSTKVPAIAMMLGVGNSNEGYSYPQHHPKAKFDDSVLFRGTAAYAYLALRWLQDNG